MRETRIKSISICLKKFSESPKIFKRLDHLLSSAINFTDKKQVGDPRYFPSTRFDRIAPNLSDSLPVVT